MDIYKLQNFNINVNLLDYHVNRTNQIYYIKFFNSQSSTLFVIHYAQIGSPQLKYQNIWKYCRDKGWDTNNSVSSVYVLVCKHEYLQSIECRTNYHEFHNAEQKLFSINQSDSFSSIHK